MPLSTEASTNSRDSRNTTTSNDITWDELAEKLFEGSENEYLTPINHKIFSQRCIKVLLDLRSFAWDL